MTRIRLRMFMDRYGDIVGPVGTFAAAGAVFFAYLTYAP